MENMMGQSEEEYDGADYGQGAYATDSKDTHTDRGRP